MSPARWFSGTQGGANLVSMEMLQAKKKRGEKEVEDFQT